MRVRAHLMERRQAVHSDRRWSTEVDFSVKRASNSKDGLPDASRKPDGHHMYATKLSFQK
jgi:hypothetical protein